MQGSTGVDVSSVCIDSRKAKPGAAFIAVKGTVADGHQFIDIAVQNRAVAIICEELPSVLKEGVVYVQVHNSAAAAGIMAHNFYGNPSEKLKLTGITGTNGKTTIATLLFKLFTSFFKPLKSSWKLSKSELVFSLFTLFNKPCILWFSDLSDSISLDILLTEPIT